MYYDVEVNKEMHLHIEKVMKEERKNEARDGEPQACYRTLY